MHAHRSLRGWVARATFQGVLAALLAGAAHAQWTQTSGPKGGSIRSLATVADGAGGTRLFAGSIYVWRTDDRGSTWTRFTNGLTDANAFSVLAVPNGSGGNDLFLGTNGGVFRSTDQGASWTAVNNGLTNLSIYALGSGPNGSGGTNLYAGAFLGDLFRSGDNGASWVRADTGLPVGQANINAIVTTSSGTVLAGTMNGIYRSTNFGATWTRVFTLYGFSFAKHGTTLYAGSSNGVYRSTNDGVSWTPINTGLGFSWIRAVAAIPNGSGGVTLYAGAGGVLRSTNEGASWSPVVNGMGHLPVWALVTAPNAGGGTDLFAGTSEGVYRTSNNGDNWTNASFISSYIQAHEVTPTGAVLAGTENDIFRSTDAGGTWTDTQAGLTTMLDFAINPHGTQGVSLFACGAPAGVHKSTNDGVTWFGSSNGLDDFDVNSIGAIPNGSGGTNLLAGTYSELFISTNDGGFWGKANLQTLTLDYAVTPNGSGGFNVFAGGFGGVWKSTNYGTAWTPVNAGLEDKAVQAMATTANGANLFAAGDPFGVYRSTDNGATWTLVNNGLTDLRVHTLLSPDGTNLFAAGGGVFLSTNHGASWTSVSDGLPGGGASLALSPDGSTLYAGAGGLGVWKRPVAEMIGGAPPPPPPSPPTIASFAPASGPVGTEVTVQGTNFGGASAVTFNAVAAASFAVISASQIRATVPAGATTGRIRVTTAAGTATSASDFTVTTAPPPPTTQTFVPAHDAYVRSTSTGSNFGSRPELGVRGGGTRIVSYLKFTVSGVAGPVQSATLRLRVTDGGSNGGTLFSTSNNFAGTSTPWTENALTWRNAPAMTGSALDAAGSVTAGTWVELDVTSAITGNGTYSFALSSSSSNVVEYSSSEGANPPELVVVSGSAAKLGETPALASIVAPRELELAGNQPNPFAGGTTIRYSLPTRTSVRLVIFDVTGRAVRTLVDGAEEAGDRRATWDARDDHGAPVRSGMYFYRLIANGQSLTRKMHLLK